MFFSDIMVLSITLSITQKRRLVSPDTLRGGHMEQENFYSFGNEDFSMTGYKCIFDLGADQSGKPVLTVRADASAPLIYAFASEAGLCITSEYGHIIEKDLLLKLVSLPDNDVKQTFSFFAEHGFILPIDTESETVIDLSSFVNLIYRIKATVSLQSLLGEMSPNYEKILKYTIYLLLSDRIRIAYGEKGAYSSCNFRINELLDAPSLAINSEDDAHEAAAKGTYTIKDTIYTPNYELNADEYGDIVSGNRFMYDYPGIDDRRYRMLTSLYKSATFESKNNRIIIDFLFHFMNQVGVIKEVSFLNGISYYANPKMEKLDINIKKALLNTARLILSQEINYNIAKMRPCFSPGKLMGTWKAPSLMTALYFSVFYRNPNYTIYRKCANPNCSNYFSVNSTNGRRKYCSDLCRNAVNQREFRIRTKKSK